MSIMSKTQKEKSGSGRIFLCAFIYNIPNKCVSFDAHTVGKGIKREGLYLSAVLAGSGI